MLQNGGNQTLAFNAAASPLAPTLTSASTTGTQISISGRVTGLAANTAITIEFFASQAGDLTTVADQASVYLGSTTVTTDGTGAATFSVSDLSVSVPKGQVITATASAIGLGTSPMAASIGAVTRIRGDDHRSTTATTRARRSARSAGDPRGEPDTRLPHRIRSPDHRSRLQPCDRHLDDHPRPAAADHHQHDRD